MMSGNTWCGAELAPGESGGCSPSGEVLTPVEPWLKDTKRASHSSY